MAEELDNLAARYLDGSATPEECAQLDRRLVSDPAAASAFLELTRQELALKDALATKGVSTAPATTVTKPVQPMVPTAMRLAGSDSAAPTAHRTVPDIRPVRRGRLVMWAAGIAAAVLVGAGVWLTTGGSNTSTTPPLAIDSQSPGASFTLDLAGSDLRVERDGKVLAAGGAGRLAGGDIIRTGDTHGTTLNVAGEATSVLVGPASSVAIVPSGSGHRVRLISGSVQCQVAPQKPGRTFAVLTADAEVRVVGTQFRVSSDGKQSLVEVSHGTVRVTRGRDRATVDVSAGEFVATEKSHGTLGHPAGKDMGEYWSNKVRPAGIDQ